MTDVAATLFDYAEARAARDAGMQLAAENSGDFVSRVLGVIRSLSGEVQGENIRAACLDRGISPRSPNAWGAAINVAVKRGLLRKTDIFRPTQSVKTHGHPTVVYIVENSHG